jgi:hypothetical protein
MTSAGPRYALAAALMAAADPALSLTVWAEEHGTPPSAPALIIRPGIPYRAESTLPGYGCSETWRLEIQALVTSDAVASLDELDVLIDLCRDVIRATPFATYGGVKQAPATTSVGARAYKGAIIELDVDVPKPEG